MTLPLPMQVERQLLAVEQALPLHVAHAQEADAGAPRQGAVTDPCEHTAAGF
jgi:hypothetical protein